MLKTQGKLNKKLSIAKKELMNENIDQHLFQI